MRSLVVVFALGVVGLMVFLVGEAGRVSIGTEAPVELSADRRLDSAVARLNQWFGRTLESEQLIAAEPADDLTVFRRLSLALHGTIPSLEEVRSFESDFRPDRIARWTLLLLDDPRFSDYFSERLARSLVGVEEGPFILFRRDRLTAWLSEHLRRDTAWTEIAADLIAAEGLWTDRPATNFLTIARIDDKEGLDENKLAGRAVRTFLGQRIDCAQCHDHPFDERWKQSDFEGLAAFFSQARITIGGITDHRPVDGQLVQHRVFDPGSEEGDGRIVEPQVPFHSEWRATEGSLREQLAGWMIHSENRRFERAIANRIWGLMFGRPLHDPVDDLPHPQDDAEPDALDILGEEFRTRGSRLSSLIRIIADSDVYRRSSESSVETTEEYNRQVQHWAVFPLIRLRPEQIIGSMIQAGSVRTIDQNSHPFIRFLRYTSESDFLKEYGDLGDDELLQQDSTIPQALLRMNGRFTAELTKVDGFSAAAQIHRFSADDAAVVENCFLACLSRRPSQDELAHFVDRFPVSSPSEGNSNDTADSTEDAEGSNPGTAQLSREELIQDIYWTLFNSPEFSWNH